MQMPGVPVPDVVGLPLEAARSVVVSSELLVAAPDPDGPPLDALAGPAAVVTAQDPAPGGIVERESAVRLWVDSGGGAVREPLTPAPLEHDGLGLDPVTRADTDPDATEPPALDRAPA
ncbi:PASTA domain-containing protein [Nakamurella flavida]|uniref:PASTA domain-containing protein n=1 Tax=Nakamurella flavida TaxID=363630 RepID=A0A938YNS2_9ACTN|nr:PASTA domain-containing protein [Nakamurella flavida]MBM9476230.1 PASTA domain-containing protein [Nakamurella flavida]MDP9779672.1 hypothetical protein [Nakamurella flavida]